MKNLFAKKTEISPGRKKGQAMVEFVLVLPVLMLVLVGLIEFSRLFFAWIIIENSTRFGVRYATTGGYDTKYCTDLDANNTPCGDASKDAEVDMARLPSIKDETRRIIIGFHYDQTYAQAANDYLNITICSALDGRIFTPPLMGRPVYADCRLPNGTFSENAASPGQRVVVAADYNFTFMVLPIFNIEPSMVHLASYREGIVELFRATRAINTPIPLNVPTPIVTPSPTYTQTPTPTNTASPTITPTPTLTFTPLDTDTPTSTPTKTSTPTSTPTNTSTPTQVPLCSNISISRRARMGVGSNNSEFNVEIINKNFATVYLVHTSLSFSPSPLTGMYYDFSTFNSIKYDDPKPDKSDASTTTSALNTNIALPPTSTNGALIGNPNGNSTAVWSTTFSASAFTGQFTVSLIFNIPGVGDCPPLISTVNNFTPTPTSTFTPSNTPTITFTPSITLTPSITPTPTITRTPSNTPPPTNTRTPSPTPQCNIAGGITTTDLVGGPQNVNGYGCPWGCVNSPYLQTNNFLPGQYYWEVWTIGNNPVQVNNGSFYLNPGVQVGPTVGFSIPLGQNMYNIPSNYFPGLFKVSVFQSAAASCGAKTDNFKILAAAPSPTPTLTSPPTLTPSKTPSPTNTFIPPTKTFTPTITPSPTPTFNSDG